jgi:hypothetical protein
MELYHGSNIEVRQPTILPALRMLDFGAGFYLTSNYQQAEQWAKVVARRRATTQAIVNCYMLDMEKLEGLKILRFTEAGEEWLEFVVANRSGHNVGRILDLVIGPVANDATLPVIDDYMDGRYTREEAIKRLLPQRLTDQYAFLTPVALERINFVRSDIL